MASYLDMAKAIEDEIVQNRRTIHGYAEVGFDLPQTHAFVMQKLKEYGYGPVSLGQCGITCTAGQPGGKVFLLRADMDALPMPEENGLPFAAVNGHHHSCCHDCHTAMLLGAAKLLKEHEQELKGTVKFMFQPAEELLSGAKDMIDHGILEDPHVDAALGMHIMVGQDDTDVGVLRWTRGMLTNFGDAVKLHISGKETHGSMPQNGVDAIHIACTTALALEEVMSRELAPKDESILLVGHMEGGTTCNSVAGEATLDISTRSYGPEERAFLLRRIEEISSGIAQTFRGTVRAEHVYDAPALINDDDLLEELVSYASEILPAQDIREVGRMNGGEDFAYVAERVPSVFLTLGGGTPETGYPENLHNPKTKIDEHALAVGAAVYAQCAARWLETHQ